MTTQRIACQIHGFSSAMNFIIFCICITLAHSVSHKFMTTYNGIYGKTIVGIPEFFVKTTLDEQQIDYCDTGMLIPKQDWMKEFASGDRWKKYIEIRERVQQINKINITVLMQQFSQSHGVHRYQRVSGCVWDDETGVSDGFDEYSYDGKRFISLDLKKGRYTAHVPQANLTVLKWNNEREQLDFLKQYYRQKCTDWLKELFNFSRATFKKTGVVSDLPGQSLTEPIQNNPTVDDTNGSGSASYALYIIYAVFLVILILIMLHALWNNWKRCKNDTYIRKYNSTPSDKCTSSPDNLSEQCLMVPQSDA